MTSAVLILGGLFLFAVGVAAVFSAGAKAVQVVPVDPPAAGDAPAMARRPFSRDLALGVAFAAVAVAQWMAAAVMNLR